MQMGGALNAFATRFFGRDLLVLAAYASGRAAADAVGMCYIANQKVPATLGEVGVSVQPGDKTVELIQLNPENAQVRVLNRIVSVHGRGTLTFAPSLDADKRVVWTCRAEDLGPQTLPPGCR